MEESVKNRIILILALLAVIFFIGMLSSCTKTYKIKSVRDKEMAVRLDAEEKANKLMQEKAAFEERIKKLTQELEEEKVVGDATKKALLQEQLINQSLKEEIHKVTKLKEALEEDLKEALASSGRPVSRSAK